MCGAFVLFACGSSSDSHDAVSQSKASILRSPHFLNLTYNLGRLFSYAALGALFGYFGHVIDLTGSAFHIQKLAIFLAGGFMIFFGLIAILRIKGVHIKHLAPPAFLIKTVTAAQRASLSFHPTSRALVIGLSAVLLPCGWLYYFAIAAAGTASPFLGAIVMSAFWLGTVPYLAAIGFGTQQFKKFLGNKASLITASLIIVLGLSMILRGFVIDTAAFADMEHQHETPAASNNRQNVIDQINKANTSDLPCCFDGSE